MKKKIVFIVLLVIAIIAVVVVWYLFSTGVSVKGTVMNAVTQKPVSGATIFLDNRTYKTNDNGVFELFTSRIPQHTITIEKKGFKPLEKQLSFSKFMETKSYDIVLEPLSFYNIFSNAQEEMKTYNSYVFKSIWKQNVDTSDFTITYMKYLINQDGTVYFKILTDDNKGIAVSQKEIITTTDKIFCKTLKDNQWISSDASQIRASELQKPEDILLLFQASDTPAEFIEEEIVDWYRYKDGSIGEQPKDGEEVVIIPLRKFIATWPQGEIEQTITLFLTQDAYQLVAGKYHMIAPESFDSENVGKMNEQELSFTITHINEPVLIELPEVS